MIAAGARVQARVRDRLVLVAARERGPTVVLVGRPNVGKSTLFNRITGTRRSIVAPVAGTTRDVLASPASWQDRTFTLVDTGGLFGATTDPLHKLVVQHGLKALDDADVFVFVLDAREGLVPADEEIAQRLRVLGRPVVLAINKTDDRRGRSRAMEFYRMGFEPALEVSAEHGDGVYELLEEMVARLPARKPAAEAPEPEVAVAIVGRPNVGKSSLVNRLRARRAGDGERDARHDARHRGRAAPVAQAALPHRRHRRHAAAGTGRERRGSRSRERRPGEARDRAGGRRRARRGRDRRRRRPRGRHRGRGRTGRLRHRHRVNKWDLVKGRGQDWVKAFDDKLRFQLKFLDYVPIVHLSALTGDRTPKLLEMVDRVAVARQRRVPTAELNRFLEAVTATHPPASKTRREVRILYGAQTGTAPPRFVLFTNVATELHFSYERFLMNRLRESFGFEGCPIRLTVRRRAGRGTGRSGPKREPGSKR